MMTKVAQKIAKENKEIRAKNKDLKKSMSQQEREREALMKELVELKKENAKLAEQSDYLKNMMVEVDDKDERKSMKESPSKISIASIHSSVAISRENLEIRKENIFQRYEGMIDTLKKQLEKQRVKLNKARNLYKSEAEGKVELQELLSQCIKDVKNDVLSKSDEKKLNSDSVQLTQADREKVIEQLLTQERVLSLLNDKIFGIEEEKKEEGRKE